MREPRYSRLLPVSNSYGTQRDLPTGKNFSGSSLSPIQSDKLVFAIVTDSISIADPALVSIPQSGGYCQGKRSATANEPQSPLIVEAGKILAIALWLWCLIGANFCLDCLNTIVSYCIQDI